MAMSNNIVISNVANAYIWFFVEPRPGTIDLLVQPRRPLSRNVNRAAFHIVVDFGSHQFIDIAGNGCRPGLGLNEGAYMSEIIRSGLMSVEPGQNKRQNHLV